MDLTYFQNYLNRALEDLVGIDNTKVGLDIEPSSAILVQLSGTLAQPKLLRSGMHAINPGIVSDERIHDVAGLSYVVAELISDTGIKKKSNVSIAAPGSLVITKKVLFKEGSDLNTFAWNEARKAFPGLADNLYLDYLPEPDNKLLLVAARKKELQDRLSAIAITGLTVEAIDVDYYALGRAYPLVRHQLKEESQKQCVAIINIDTNALILTIFQNNELIFFHRQSYNGTFLTTSENPLQSESSKEAIDAQTKRLLQFFQAEMPGKKLAQTLLSGRFASLPGMRELIETATNSPTQLANPLGGLMLGSALNESLAQQAPALMISCGLAMRGLRA
jgi:type IV pilus assembly protein PilM